MAGGLRRRSLLAAALAAAPVLAAGDGWSLQLQPGWSSTRSVQTDETGHETEAESEIWLQKYRLSLDRSLLPLLTFSASGFLDWSMGTQRAGDVSSEVDYRRWSGAAGLKAGGGFLNGALDYTRREEVVESTTAGVTNRSPHLVRDTYAGAASWRPSELPSVDLRVGRADTHDRARDVTDQTSFDASLALRYQPTKELNLQYSLKYAEAIDRKTEVESASLSNAFFAAWGDTFRGGRVAAYLNYNAGTRSGWFQARGPGGFLERQQIPSGGLSKVELPLDTPTRVTLNANALLVDGNTVASAGLNLGYSASAAGDTANRDLGGVFPNVITPVNRIHVYLDRQISDPAILQEFVTGLSQWNAYQSDDNLDWTAVAVDRANITFDPFLNRFEIPLAAEVRARHLKVVTRPLRTAVTTDPQMAEIFVTEIQFLLRTPASEVPPTSFAFSQSLNGTAKVALLKSPALTYDVTAFLTDDSETDRITYSVVNGLSFSKRLSRVFLTAARVERSDSDAGRGHEALNRWSASLSADPLPTLGGSLTYTGQLAQRPTGNAVSHSAGAYARADLYQGISLGGSATVSLADDERGITTRATALSASASVVPNRVVSASASAAYTESEQRGGGKPDRTDDSGVVEGTVSLSPFPALALAASLSRFFAVPSPATLASFSGSFSPFPGGALVLRYGYQETLDTRADARTRTHGPSVRWNIRQGWYLDGGATFAYSEAPAQTIDTQSVFANLLITLR
ncbi:MAG TPA: hypothetical protein VLS93_16200 [Anaeromyxobacteraceae bacterium]|nr:hypothetical protein [Anaeromyxobacteraceae bacterium]